MEKTIGEKVLRLNEALKIVNDYVDGINKIIPDRSMSMGTQAELRRFHSKFVNDLREVYLEFEKRHEVKG